MSSAAIVLGLALFSSLLVFNVNLLAWPVGSEISHIQNRIAESLPVARGMLRIVAQVNETYAPSPILIRTYPGSTESAIIVLEQGSEIAPLTEIPVSISAAGPSSVPLSVLTNPLIVLTNTSGEIETLLAPNLYTVNFEDWRLNNLSVNLQVYSGQITQLNVVLNASSYGIQYFDVADSDNSGWVSSWQQVFALLPTAMPLTLQGESTYLATNFSFFGFVKELTNNSFTPVSITSSLIGNNSEWVQLQVREPLRIGEIHTLNLIAMKTFYMVSIIAP